MPIFRMIRIVIMIAAGVLLLGIVGSFGVGAEVAGRASAETGPRAAKHILLVASYHLGHPGTGNMVSRIYEGIRHLPYRSDLNIVELDALRNDSPEEWLRRFKKQVGLIQSGQYDLIVALDDEAVNLVLQQVGQMPTCPPIVFGGYESYRPSLRAKFPNITGVTQEFDIVSTIQAGLRLMPDLTHVVILCDKTPAGCWLEENLQEIIPPFPGIEVQFINDRNFSTPQMLRYLQDMPETTLVVLTPWRSLGSDDYQTVSSFGIDLKAHLARPYMVTTGNLFSYGALGGFISRPETHADKIVALMDQVLRAGSAKDVPVVTGPLEPVFDHGEMTQHGLSFDELPASTIYVNRPQSIWVGYRQWLLLAAVFALLLIGGLIGYIVHSRRSYRLLAAAARREQALAEINAQSLRNLQYAASLARISYFECDISGRSLNPYLRTDNWGYDEAGHALSPDKWVFKDDQELFWQEWRKLFQGTVEEIKFTYRSNYTGKMRHFIFLGTLRNPENRLESSVFGAIQEVTEIDEIRQQLLDVNQLWRSMLDTLPVHFFAKEVEDDFKYVFTNRDLQKFFGRTEEEMSVSSDFVFLPPEQAQKFRDIDEQVVLSGEGRDSVEQIIDAEGAVHYMFAARRLLTLSGGRRLLIGGAMDVSAQELAKRRETESRMMLQALLDNIPTGVVVKDADRQFRYLLSNQAYCRLVGRTRESFIGKDEWEAGIFDGQEAGQLESDRQVMAEGRARKSAETYDFLHSGRVFCEKYEIPVHLPDGRNLLLIALNDVTVLNHLVDTERMMNESLSHVVLENDFRRNLQALFKVISAHMVCDGFCVTRWEAAAGEYVAEHEWYHECLIPRQELTAVEVQSLFRAGHAAFCRRELFWVSDTEAAECDPIWKRLTRCRSVIGVPIYVNEVLWGAFWVGFGRYKRVFSEVDFGFMQAVANLLALARIKTDNYTAMMVADREKQMILNNIKIPLWLFGPDRNLLRVNTAVQEMTGLSEEVLLNTPCHQIFCGRPENPECLLAKVTATRAPESRRIVYREREYIIFAQPIFSPEGTLLNIVLNAIDITQQQQAVEAALAANRSKDLFIASVSHQLRSPLLTVLGFSELLQNESLSREERSEYLRSIADSGNALMHLIGDVLALSSFDAGEERQVLLSTDFAAFCAEQLRFFQDKATQKNLRCRLEMETMPLVVVDQVRIRQILFNLIENAVKFTESGEICVWADFARKHGKRGTLRFAVRDSGIGIAAEDRQKIFEPFIQIDQRGTAQEGAGLGLPVVMRMVEQLKGRIFVESTKDGGAEFRVELNDVEFRSKNDCAPAEAVAATGEFTTVLIVDDVAMNLQVLAAMLNKQHVHTLLADSAAAGLQILAENQVDAVLTDLWMPGMDGETFARKIRATAAGAALPIIAVTADIECPKNFKLDVFSAVIYKPVSAGQLHEILAQIL